MVICWFSTLFTWYRYSFFSASQKSTTYFVVEIFRFMIFFFVCYYFGDKASNLLPDKESIKTGLQIFFNLSFVLSLGLSIWIYVQIIKSENGNNSHGISPGYLCKSWTFQLFRWDNILLSALLGSLFCIMKKRSQSIPQETKMDKLNFAIQTDTLRRLGIAISWFLLASLFSCFMDLVSAINANEAGESCSTSLFPPSVYFLNAIFYFISRWLSNILAVWTALCLFYKKSKLDKPKKIIVGPEGE